MQDTERRSPRNDKKTDAEDRQVIIWSNIFPAILVYK